MGGRASWGETFKRFLPHIPSSNARGGRPVGNHLASGNPGHALAFWLFPEGFGARWRVKITQK